jgi:phage head maturation protease
LDRWFAPPGRALGVMRNIGSGLMDQCSFAFRVIDQDWNSDRTVRTIKEVPWTEVTDPS